MTRRRILIQPPPSSRSIIPVDSGLLRAAWVRKYRRALKDAERERRKIQTFEDEGKSAFSTWHLRCFFRDLNEIREMHDQISHLRQVLQAIELEAHYLGISRRAVYPLVKKRVEMGVDPLSDEAREHHREHQAELERQERERMNRLSSGELNSEDEQEFRGEFEDALRERLGHRVHALDPDDVEELFHDYLDAAFDRAREEKDRENSRNRDSESTSHSHAEPETEEPPATSDPMRLKRLYRELAFRLHPDLNPDLTAREKTLWGEVQTAYENRDVERLEILQGLLENTDEASIEKISSISRLMELTQEVLSEIRALKNRIKNLRVDPAYRFWIHRENPNQLATLQKELGREYRHEVEDLSGVLKQLERELRRFSKPAPPSKRS